MSIRPLKEAATKFREQLASNPSGGCGHGMAEEQSNRDTIMARHNDLDLICRVGVFRSTAVGISLLPALLQGPRAFDSSRVCRRNEKEDADAY